MEMRTRVRLMAGLTPYLVLVLCAMSIRASAENLSLRNQQVVAIEDLSVRLAIPLLSDLLKFLLCFLLSVLPFESIFDSDLLFSLPFARSLWQ